MKERFVLLDFDGVIADTQEIATRAAQVLCPVLTKEAHMRMFEGNIFDSHDAHLSQIAHVPECRHDMSYWDAYLPMFYETAAPFSRAREALESMSAAYTIIVVSSTISGPIGDFLSKYGMRPLITEVMGGDVHKSKVEKMRMVFERYGTTPAHSVFVTDTLGDMREAEEHGVGAIGVSWGFHDRATLERGLPFRIVDTPGELPDAVANYFGQ